MIAQDTGGAIVGPARADLYFGAGDEAASVAGRLRHNARFVMLVPKSLLPASDDEIPLPRPRPANLMSDESAPAETPDAKLVPAVAAAKPEPAPDVKASEPVATKTKPAPAKKLAKTTEKPPEKAAEKKPEKSADKPAKKKDEKAAEEKKPVKTSKRESKSESKPKSKFEPRSGPKHDPQT
jgi:membrane-bound lytic murein transglycosylase A